MSHPTQTWISNFIRVWSRLRLRVGFMLGLRVGFGSNLKTLSTTSEFRTVSATGQPSPRSMEAMPIASSNTPPGSQALGFRVYKLGFRVCRSTSQTQAGSPGKLTGWWQACVASYYSGQQSSIDIRLRAESLENLTGLWQGHFASYYSGQQSALEGGGGLGFRIRVQGYWRS